MKASTKVLFIAALLLPLYSCSKNDAEASRGTAASMALATAGPESSNVFMIKEVGERKSAGHLADFAWKGRDGRTVWLSDHAKDKLIFLNFWGTWCPPCRKEIPDIIEISKENQDVVVVGIALEKSPSPVQHVAQFAEKNSMNYINVTGNRPLLHKLADLYGGVHSVPTTVILNSRHEIVETITGMRSKAQFMRYIQSARS